MPPADGGEVQRPETDEVRLRPDADVRRYPVLLKGAEHVQPIVSEGPNIIKSAVEGARGRPSGAPVYRPFGRGVVFRDGKTAEGQDTVLRDAFGFAGIIDVVAVEEVYPCRGFRGEFPDTLL